MSLAFGREKDGIPLTTEEVAVRLRMLPEEAHDLLKRAGAKLRERLLGAAARTPLLFGRCLLLVEDDPRTAAELSALFGGALGMRVATAKTADAAMKLLQGACDRGEFPIAILDLHLPETEVAGQPVGGGRHIGERLAAAIVPRVPAVVLGSLRNVSDPTLKSFQGQKHCRGAVRCVEKPCWGDLVEATVSLAALVGRDAAGQPPSLPLDHLRIECARGVLEVRPGLGEVRWRDAAFPVDPAGLRILEILVAHQTLGVCAPSALLFGALVDGSEPTDSTL